MTIRAGLLAVGLFSPWLLAAQQAPQPATAAPPPPSAEGHLDIKYVRDSEEYAALARQVYRQAGEAVTRNAPDRAAGAWAVVLDVDETALDNSTYQLDRAAYGLSFESSSWNAWVERRQAAAVPGVVDFVTLVRHAGGHVAWITNRDTVVFQATRDNLRLVGLWSDDDRLCTQKSPQHTKAQRRAEIVAGSGDCSWNGQPARIVAFVGDQMGDFPGPSETIPGAGSDDAFGRTCFLLPNPMYGNWSNRVTRIPR